MDVIRKLRRGEWVPQDKVDLHGLRSDEAREALSEFLRRSVRNGVRCVRVIHGKGIGSPDKLPVLKGKVRSWLVQKEEVIAFVQAREALGGAGALMVLLRQPRADASSARIADGALPLILHVMEVIGMLSFAVSGVVDARKQRLDVVGTFVVAFATAFGGGTVRDVLLDRRPFYWVEHEGYVLLIFAMSIGASFVLRVVSRVASERTMIVADAIGLGLFSVTGARWRWWRR